MPGNSTAWLRQVYGTPEKFRASWTSEPDPEPEPPQEEENEVRYKTVMDAPDYARPTLYKLMEEGILLGDGNTNQNKRLIDLSEDQVRILVMLDRAGVFGE